MSSKDGQSPPSSAVTASPTVVPIADVSPGTRAHHFDESSEWTQYALASVSSVDRLDTDTAISRLSRGDTVTFIGHVRVQ